MTQNDCHTPAHRAPARTPLLLVVAACLGLALSPAAHSEQAVHADPLNRTPEVHEAFDHFYNHDYDGALARFERIAKAHPQEPIAIDYMLYTVLFRELNRLDLLDTTFYANDGFLTGKHQVVEDLAVRDQIKRLSDQAVAAAQVRLDRNSHDLNALFARGWARSLEATYGAMVERTFTSSMRMALGARGDHAQVLREDPSYADANLVVGTYEYVVGALPLSFRLLIGIAGFHGNKDKGMDMLRVAAAHGTITTVEARTCMMLFLRREARYQEALTIAHSLASQYPHGFLFQLEEANLAKDAGTGQHAIDIYRHVLALNQQPGYFVGPHLELAWFGLGESLRGQKMYPDAVAAYKNAAYMPNTSPELKRRCLLAAGESYDLANDHTQALAMYRQVLDAGSDSSQAEEARKYMRHPYSGPSA